MKWSWLNAAAVGEHCRSHDIDLQFGILYCGAWIFSIDQGGGWWAMSTSCSSLLEPAEQALEDIRLTSNPETSWVVEPKLLLWFGQQSSEERVMQKLSLDHKPPLLSSHVNREATVWDIPGATGIGCSFFFFFFYVSPAAVMRIVGVSPASQLRAVGIIIPRSNTSRGTRGRGTGATHIE